MTAPILTNQPYNFAQSPPGKSSKTSLHITLRILVAPNFISDIRSMLPHNLPFSFHNNYAYGFPPYGFVTQPFNSYYHSVPNNSQFLNHVPTVLAPPQKNYFVNGLLKDDFATEGFKAKPEDSQAAARLIDSASLAHPPLTGAVNTKSFIQESISIIPPPPDNDWDQVSLSGCSIKLLNFLPNTKSFSSSSFARIKKLIYHYFYKQDYLNIPFDFDPKELDIIKIFLVKKLVHDKKKSKVFLLIKKLTNEDLLPFVTINPAVNRKNIIKSNIFKRVWKILEKKNRHNFVSFYFGELDEKLPEETFSIKHYRRNHCFNLADEFYSRCFLSSQFRHDFFKIVQDAAFKALIIEQSTEKFNNNFDLWMSEIILFLQRVQKPFERKAKLPDFKFGMSIKDVELASDLFDRLVFQKD